MKKVTLFILISIAFSSVNSLNAQLANTTWMTYWNAPFNDSIQFQFTVDTMFITNSVGAEMATGMFIESNDTLWTWDVSGPWACPPADTGIFTFLISGNGTFLDFNLISDNCTGRGAGMDSGPFTGNNGLVDINIFHLDKAIVSLFPNPVKDHLNIDFKNEFESFNIGIFDLSGKLIYKNHFENTSLINIDFSLFDSGIYLIRLYSNTESSIFRINKVN